MRVAVDQSRRDPAAAAIDGFRPGKLRRGQLGGRAGEQDAAIAHGDGPILDDAQSGPGGIERHQPRIGPDAVVFRHG
jgi:hypothetical protein